MAGPGERTQNAWTFGTSRLWLSWEASDPDWLRLMQSLKTVLAVALAMSIVFLHLEPALYPRDEVCRCLESIYW